MQKFQEILNEQTALRFIYEKLNIKSSIGRQLILNQTFISNPKHLDKIFDELAEITQLINNGNHKSDFSKLQHLIADIRNITLTIENIGKSYVADDIQLFEIKHFAILSENISELINVLNISFLELNSLKKVIDILDPDKQGIPHFYIFSSYSSKLADYRSKLEYYQNHNNPDKAEEFRTLCNDEEDIIRKSLSLKLKPFCSNLTENLNKIAQLDVMIAKAQLAVSLGLCKPEISITKTEYIEIFNPLTDSLLKTQGKEFQPIEISINKEPYLITGANMTGKTVLLKTIALAQYMFQFGFYVPASSARIEPVEKLLLNIGESDQEISGLSSFATEILNINEIISEIKKGKKVMVLVDELARTTNPDEGKAFVSAFLEILSSNKIKSMVTTHYSGIKSKCKKLRVNGFTEKSVKEKITIKNINDYIDYSLSVVEDDNVPAEAIKIAEILGVDNLFLDKVKDNFLGG